MDKEESKIGPKRKPKPREMLFESGDDEPIGTLLKLKGKKNSKKIKAVSDGGGKKGKVVEKVPAKDVELGMDDTLANFRKRLRGSNPKKDYGSVAAEEKHLSSDTELVPNCISRLQEKGLSSTDGEYSVNVVKSSNVKSKKISKVNSDIKLDEKESELHDDSDLIISENDKLKHETECVLESRDEVLEDSLSPSNMRACSIKMNEVQNGEVNLVEMKKKTPLPLQDTSVDTKCDKEDRLDHQDTQLGPTFLSVDTNICSSVCEEDPKPRSESNLLNKRLDDTFVSTSRTLSDEKMELLMPNSELEKIGCNIKPNCGLDTGLHSVLPENVSTSALDRPKEEHPCIGHDSSVLINDKGSDERDLASISSQEENRKVSEYWSSLENHKYEVATRMNHENENVNESEPVLESSHELFPPNYDFPYGDEIDMNTYAATTLDEGSSPEDIESLDGKESGLSVRQRAARNVKKRRHGDMAYEGDADWEVLVQGQEFFVSHRMADKTRDKLNSSFVALDAESGKVAAVSAGLRARAVGPIERINFKEVLKRKGGLQEYLECRNHILSAWNKDVSSILQLSDLGVSDALLEGESPRASLVRDIYLFLDQCGYINFGVPSEKEKVVKYIKHDSELVTEKPEEKSGFPIADSGDVVSSRHGNEKSSGICTIIKNDEVLTDVDEAGNFKAEADSDYLCSNPSYKDENGANEVSVVPSEIPKCFSIVLPSRLDRTCSQTQIGPAPRKSIIVVGAGPAGLTAARHLKRQGFNVTVLEARSRIGGRVFTDRSSLSVPVDLGASIITGVEADVDTERRPDPSSLICAQLGLELSVLNSDCPLYDTVTAEKVPTNLDEALEAEFNSLLDEMEVLVSEKGKCALKMSLEEGLEYALKRHRLSSKIESLSPLERRVMDWHFAHLEYGCAASLKEVSLPNWNQDDVYGGFGGAHCMIKGGYSAVVDSLKEGINIQLDLIVTDIAYFPKEYVTHDMHSKVKVSTSNCQEFSGDAVLVTVPLGCLKAESIKFSPPLPDWKYSSIQRLGFGVLNKVVLEFSEVFWDDTVDYFGATSECTDQRGRCFMFWNIKKTVGAPVLIALVVGKAAIDGQELGSSDQVSHALLVLRKLFGEDRVSDPVASVVTDWGKDPFSYGAYSYVAVGSSGEDYDILGRPVDNCVFFAGEATCKEHPDTVGGAMMSGLREAVRIIDILNNGVDCTAEVEEMEAVRRHTNIQKSEVKDLIRRLEAVEFSSFMYINSSDRLKISKWGSMLKDMFFNAKTTAGRLHLAKELLNLPVGFLKSFASTREGLSTLNSWILDSMGKDGTQLLRHCVRLLVLVSNDLLAVRLSGIGKTVKEKVCVHTSRDIRAIASQLVNVWVELFRKEKAARRGLKPPLRTHHAAPESKETSKVSASKKLTAKPVKMEARIDPRADITEESSEIPMSEEENAAIEAAEAARSAAIAAAKAYASYGAMNNTQPQLPKILSFQKFATREQSTPMDERDSRKNWPGAAIRTQDCLSEIDSRNCRVRDWSVDFSHAGVNLDNPKTSVDNRSSHSNEIASQLNFREHSGESVAVDNSYFTKAWVDSDGTTGLKDYSAIERWQCQAAAASSGFSHDMIKDELDSNSNAKLDRWKNDAPRNDSSASQVSINKETRGGHVRGAERIKQSVVDYVASLLMPLYKARKIDKEGYKSIMKKTATKVMEQATDAEKAMAVSEFLDSKRKNKIRAFVDMLIERHLAKKSDGK